MPTSKRLEDLENRFSQLENRLEDSPEKEGLSILHAMLQETRKQSFSMQNQTPTAGSQEHSLEEISSLYKKAPAMQGKAESEGLPVGGVAPDFTLSNADNQPVSLSDFKGKTVVLVFYPLDWSPACSDQLSLYQSELDSFKELNAEVIGISVDSIYSHGAWAAVRGLSIPLLADFHPKGQVASTYQIMRKSDGFSERALFVIDAQGNICYKFISPELDHIPDIYELFDQLHALVGGDYPSPSPQGMGEN